MKDFNWIRVNNDASGNPRYVTHFLNLLTSLEISLYSRDSYPMAVRRAKNFGGKKYHTKEYRGGIVFSAPETRELEKQIESYLDGVL